MDLFLHGEKFTLGIVLFYFRTGWLSALRITNLVSLCLSCTKPLVRKIQRGRGLFSQTLKSMCQDEFPPRIFKQLADEILRAISGLFLRTQERWLQYKRLNLKNGKHGIPMEEEELDSYREIAEQIMTGFHCTENNKEQQAGFIKDISS